MGRTSRIRRYSDRYVGAFTSFIQLVDNAAVTYKVNSVEVDQKNERSKEIRFNLSESPERYRLELSDHFSELCDEVEEQINNIYSKAEKLQQINRYVVEMEAVAAMLVKSGSDVFNHIRFSFTNISGEDGKEIMLTERDVQAYYHWMHLYIQKAASFLLSLRDTTINIAQSDFPVPKAMLPNPNVSSASNPIAFFEYLFTRNGIVALRGAFIPDEDDYHYSFGHIHYDPATETKTIEDYHPETGEPDDRVFKFSDELMKRGYQEFVTTKKAVDERVLQAKERNEVQLFFELMVHRVKYFFEFQKRNKELQKYPDLVRFPTALIRFFYNKYGSFCPPYEKDEVLLNVLGGDEQTAQLLEPNVKSLPAAPNPRSFLWARGESNRLTGILHGKLGGILLDVAQHEELRRAFSGEIAEKPIGLKWIDQPKNGSKVNKGSLLYLFKRLCDERLIDIDFNSSELLQKLEFVFADPQGGKLMNLKESRAQLKNRRSSTHAKQLIDEAITVMLS